MQVFVGAKRTARWLGLKENGLSPQEKLVRRREDIKPGYDAFREWVEIQHKNVLTKGAIDRALHCRQPTTSDRSHGEQDTTSGAVEEKLLICNLIILRNYKIGTWTYGHGCGNACQSSGKSASVNCLTFMSSGMSMVMK